jgi:pimeloyl-ACP methyl ester carboxylesterase
MIPTSILRIWFLGLLALGIIAGAARLGHEWYRRSWSYDPALQRSSFDPQLGWNELTLMLAGALLLGFIAIAGKLLVKAVLGAGTKRKTGEESPYAAPTPTREQRIERPDGSVLQVKLYGPEDSTPIVATHGWGMNSTEWNYLVRELSSSHRLITWDEPGLGASKRPTSRDYSLENLARNLEGVLSATAPHRPAILLGHSIGGMITLTFCRLFPEALGTRVAGLVLTNTTYTNPVRTAKGAALYTAIEKPILVPLMHFAILLSPLLWLMNWLSYRNGSAHLSTKRSSFAGTQTWEQLDFAAHFQAISSPAVVARGMLGMIRYDATPTLRTITTPTLIVCGDQDPLTKPEASERMQKDISAAALIRLAPAKHLALIEHHGRYATAVREFVAKLATSEVAAA